MRHSGVAGNILAWQRQGRGFDPGSRPQYYAWSLHGSPCVNVGFLRVLRFPPTLREKHERRDARYKYTRLLHYTDRAPYTFGISTHGYYTDRAPYTFAQKISQQRCLVSWLLLNQKHFIFFQNLYFFSPQKNDNFFSKPFIFSKWGHAGTCSSYTKSSIEVYGDMLGLVVHTQNPP